MCGGTEEGGRHGDAPLQETAQSMPPDAALWINVSLVLRPGPGNLAATVCVTDDQIMLDCDGMRPAPAAFEGLCWRGG